MRIEGFVSLIGCVMFLFVLSFGIAALTREVRVMLPDAAKTMASVPSETSRSSQREHRRSH